VLGVAGAQGFDVHEGILYLRNGQAGEWPRA
jgi:RsiW-degrading membrane proteinase PrsW (M82 family)